MHNQAFDYVRHSMERKTLHITDDWGHSRKGRKWIATQTAMNVQEMLQELADAGFAVNNVNK